MVSVIGVYHFWAFRSISICEIDVGGKYCPCPVLVSFLSEFSGKSCTVSVCCPDFVRIFVKKTVRCLSVRILSVSILSAVRILSGIFEKCCPLSVCPAGQERDRAVRTFGVLVPRRLLWNGSKWDVSYCIGVVMYVGKWESVFPICELVDIFEFGLPDHSNTIFNVR